MTSCLLTEICRSAVYSTTIWLSTSWSCCVRRVRLERQVDVDALLRERQGRHEDDQQHEQHVDQRRDVHVRTGVRDLALDDLVGAEVLVCVCHGYLPPASPARTLRSVMRPMFSICASRSWSIAAITDAYGASSSALMRTIFSFLRLEDLGDLLPQVVLADRHRVQVHPPVGGDGDDGLVLRLRLVRRVRRLRQPDVDALLQHRRDEHHDDEQHQHDVDERRHVDVGLDSALCAANIH